MNIRGKGEASSGFSPLPGAGKQINSMKLDILDYSEYGNEADTESDALLKAASEALGYRTRVITLAPDKTIPKPEKRVWLRYDLRSPGDLTWIINVAEDLAEKGHLLFPSARSILLSEDKWETHLALDEAGVPSVETYGLHMTHPWGARTILKPRVGWGGIGMRVLDDDAALSFLPEGREHYIWQPFIPHRQTWTVALAGGHLVAILEKRATSNDFRTNAYFGEQAVEVCGPGAAAAIADLALRAVGLVAGAVDVIGVDGQLKVLEVNSAPCLWYDHLPTLDLAGSMLRCVMDWMDR
jgi:glutathione synthase/RimK-type ligase-like ATP-grasp enzyme